MGLLCTTLAGTMYYRFEDVDIIWRKIILLSRDLPSVSK